MSRETAHKVPAERPLFALPCWAGWLCTMKMIRCREMFAEFPIDPIFARRAVPPGYNIRILSNEMALLLLMVQDCEHCILDGVVRVSSMRMSHIWIEIEGPEEIGVVLPGTELSLPTCYYYALPHQIDSSFAKTLLSLVGLDVQKVNAISLGGAPGRGRHGSVLENRDGHEKYSWEDSCTIWATPRIVTGRRRFYREYGRTLKRRSEGLVVCRSSFLGEGVISLNADSSPALGLIGIRGTLQGTMSPVEMEYCNVRIRVEGCPEFQGHHTEFQQ